MNLKDRKKSDKLKKKLPHIYFWYSEVPIHRTIEPLPPPAETLSSRQNFNEIREKKILGEGNRINQNLILRAGKERENSKSVKLGEGERPKKEKIL